MPRALSVDLRERSLAALASGLSVTEVATRFDVSRSSLYRWQRKRAATGALQTHPDATLGELCATVPVAVSPTTMGRTLRKLGLARKKRA